MIKQEMDRIVAENCEEYVDKISMTSNMLSSNCNTCSRCINYDNGICNKNNFNVIKDIVSMN